MSAILEGKRVLITHVSGFMGPTLVDVFNQHQARVYESDHAFATYEETQAVVDAAIEDLGAIDVLVANLSVPAPSTMANRVSEEEWREMFAAIVDPLPRLAKAILPHMIRNKKGKILVMGSAAALRGINRTTTYSAARGAQLAYVQSLGIEVARHNIQVNAIAQNFVDNPTYFPEEVKANPQFQERLKREVPLGRLVKAEEDAELAAYLCSDNADCFVGQVFPLSGGWAIR